MLISATAVSSMRCALGANAAAQFHIALPHFEADKCGALNAFLAACSQAVPLCSRVASMRAPRKWHEMSISTEAIRLPVKAPRFATRRSS